MTDWESIGLPPRKVIERENLDGEVVEWYLNPFRPVPLVIGEERIEPNPIWKPW